MRLFASCELIGGYLWKTDVQGTIYDDDVICELHKKKKMQSVTVF